MQHHFELNPIRRRTLLLAWVLAIASITVPCPAYPPTGESQEDITETDPKAATQKETDLLAGTRQLTFEGRRAGEGYFNSDGTQLVFQSERTAGNPFYQIYTMDLDTGDVERISPGIGKTTCAWIHPNKQMQKVLFASTHDDKDAVQKQKDEIAMRESGQERRYAWDYDEHFELYEFDRQTKSSKNLTNTIGYDAEASWSPDGTLVAFTSNRQAYSSKLTDEEQKNFEVDPAYLNDIYIMDSDGANVRQLTSVAGYDGGPFFSPDGKRLCWRRFTPNGAIAEIWTMKIDGTDQRQLTRLGAMSWAPYYHPSGEYLIFTTNRHGFANFELYLVDTEGKSEPVRVSYTKGFDGLPVFTPDGTRLAWTSNRTAAKQSQIFMADWNHAKARELLGLDASSLANLDTREAEERAMATAKQLQTAAAFTAQDSLRHVGFLCREELAGRLTGTPGEKQATAYVAAYLDSLGVQPAGDAGTWFQEFEFTSGVALGPNNSLEAGETSYVTDTQWRPLSFSGNGKFDAGSVVFAGYAMQVPETDDQEEYDSYVHLDVKDKWVLAFRYLPENITPERRQQLSRASQLRFKATVARDHGAKGLIVVTGPNAKAKSELVPLRLDGMLAGSSLPVISVTDNVAQAWLQASGKNLKNLQDRLDTGELAMGFEVEGIQLAAKVDVEQTKNSGRNVLGRLQIGDAPSEQVVLVGAHVDHLGRGESSSSLARDNEVEQIHFGADDNASGVAAMLEIAEYVSDQKKQGKLTGRRDLIFAAWSGEELGLLGSDHFVKTYGDGSSGGAGHGNVQGPTEHSIYPAIAACINMDMVGRLQDKLVLQGIGSSSIWRSEIERRNAPVGLSITLQDDSYLPTDASSFYKHGVPVLSAFTGSHSEYHTPRDTPDTLNYEGAASIARLMGLITRSLVMREAAPDYQQQESKPGPTRGGMRATLGTIPDYVEEVKGVYLSGVGKGGPADQAGVKGQDVIVELAGKKIENIYDYTHAIEALKIGEKVKLVVLRGEKRVELEIVPGSRE